MKTTDKIIQLLKTKGSLTAKSFAEALKMTTMGVRQHLQLLEEEGNISYQDIKALRGRPTRYWSLTTQSNELFANGHQELTVQLIDSVKTIFGDEGLDKLITHREKENFNSYKHALDQHTDLLSKLNTLAKLRSDEGYIATIERINGDYWLMENHCPICAAASKCLKFCRSELELFQSLLKNHAVITREEHIIEGARRCAYKVSAVP